MRWKMREIFFLLVKSGMFYLLTDIRCQKQLVANLYINMFYNEQISTIYCRKTSRILKFGSMKK